MLNLNQGLESRRWRTFSFSLPGNGKDLQDAYALAANQYEKDFPDRRPYDDTFEVLVDGDTDEPDSRLIIRYEITPEVAA